MTYQKSLFCLRKANYDWQGTRYARQGLCPAVDTPLIMNDAFSMLYAPSANGAGIIG